MKLFTKDLKVGMFVRNIFSNDKMRVIGVDRDCNLFFLTKVFRDYSDPDVVATDYSSLGTWRGDDDTKWEKLHHEAD